MISVREDLLSEIGFYKTKNQLQSVQFSDYVVSLPNHRKTPYKTIFIGKL